MQLNANSIRHHVRHLFRKRNVIIISDDKVSHLSLSPTLQACVAVATVSCLCWASYSTGSYFSDRSTMKVQRQALRQVTNARIETSFNQVLPGTGDTMPDGAPATAPLTDPSLALVSLDSKKLVARISFLERKVSELQTSNNSIIARVRDKTSGHIDDLESIIKRTGLSPDDLKKQAADDAPSKPKIINGQNAQHVQAQGGPYIPASTLDMQSGENELYNTLDELSVLRQIVGNLPLSMPIKNAEEQSPFGHRFDPFTGRLAYHSGLDLSGPAGSRIYSTADGDIVTAARSGAYGNMIDIDHGYGITTRYGHLSAILVKEGQHVHRGDLIGIQGSTGRSTGAHLHYEVRYNDQPMNPKNFLEVGRYVSQE